MDVMKTPGMGAAAAVALIGGLVGFHQPQHDHDARSSSESLAYIQMLDNPERDT